MTHYWIQTWQELCVYYITRHQAHLSFITYISSPSKRVKEEGEDLTQSLMYRRCFSFQAEQILSSRLSMPFLSSLFLFFLLAALLWEPVKYNNTGVNPGTHKMILPAGILREILETHQWGHPTLLSSHTNVTVQVDLRSMESCESVPRVSKQLFQATVIV